MPFLDLSGRGAEVRDRIEAAVRRGGHGQFVKIVAVTKTHPAQAVLAAMAAGLFDVGENKVQEALAKQDRILGMGGDTVGALRWHLIGHLQRNKVKHLRSFSLFHALDSSRLAGAIQTEFQNTPERVNVLLQVNVSGEESKGGHPLSDVGREGDRVMRMENISVRGVMTMAPFDAGEKVLREVFAGARRAREVLKAAGHPAEEISMGMSQDFVVAVEEGATIVRLGTALFGERMI